MTSRRRALASLSVLALTSALRAQGAAPVLLVLGDSLSAEYGLRRDTGWVKLLANRLAQSGTQYTVVNASISGETTSGGRSRLPTLLTAHHPAIVVIQLGGNDGLRGLSLASVRANLQTMIVASQKIGARVLLIGMRMPPNFGRGYSERFFATYGEVAREHKAALTPFLLEGFGENLTMFQPDRIHPTEAAQPLMLANVWPHLQPLLSARIS